MFFDVFLYLFLGYQKNIRKYCEKNYNHKYFHLKIFLRAFSSHLGFYIYFSKLFSGFQKWTFLKMSKIQNPKKVLKKNICY